MAHHSGEVMNLPSPAHAWYGHTGAQASHAIPMDSITALL